MISEIEAWFSSVGFVYMLLSGQWIGRPKDNIYTLKKCYQREEALVLDLGEGWEIECAGSLSLNKKKKKKRDRFIFRHLC